MTPESGPTRHGRIRREQESCHADGNQTGAVGSVCAARGVRLRGADARDGGGAEDAVPGDVRRDDWRGRRRDNRPRSRVGSPWGKCTWHGMSMKTGGRRPIGRDYDTPVTNATYAEVEIARLTSIKCANQESGGL